MTQFAEIDFLRYGLWMPSATYELLVDDFADSWSTMVLEGEYQFRHGDMRWWSEKVGHLKTSRASSNIGRKVLLEFSGAFFRKDKAGRPPADCEKILRGVVSRWRRIMYEQGFEPLTLSGLTLDRVDYAVEVVGEPPLWESRDELLARPLACGFKWADWRSSKQGVTQYAGRSKNPLANRGSIPLLRVYQYRTSPARRYEVEIPRVVAVGGKGDGPYAAGALAQSVLESALRLPVECPSVAIADLSKLTTEHFDEDWDYRERKRFYSSGCSYLERALDSELRAVFADLHRHGREFNTPDQEVALKPEVIDRMVGCWTRLFRLAELVGGDTAGEVETAYEQLERQIQKAREWKVDLVESQGLPVAEISKEYKQNG